jgi:hypothetical protein
MMVVIAADPAVDTDCCSLIAADPAVNLNGTSSVCSAADPGVVAVLPVVPDFQFVVVEMGVAVVIVADPAINSTPLLPTPVVCSATRSLLASSISHGCC